MTTSAILTRVEREANEEGLKTMVDRGSGAKWAKGSCVPAKNYLNIVGDMGPFARVQSWEEAITVDGGYDGWRRAL